MTEERQPCSIFIHDTNIDATSSPSTIIFLDFKFDDIHSLLYFFGEYLSFGLLDSHCQHHSSLVLPAPLERGQPYLQPSTT